MTYWSFHLSVAPQKVSHDKQQYDGRSAPCNQRIAQGLAWDVGDVAKFIRHPNPSDSS